MIEYLNGTDQLEDFLKEHYRTLQKRIHPDKGGDTGLSVLINEAYCTIQQHPHKIKKWIATMQNGEEYKEVLEAIVPEMEQLRKENRELREQYARACIEKAGASIDAPVRTTSPYPKRSAYSHCPRSEVRTPPKVDPVASTVKITPRSPSTPADSLKKPTATSAKKYRVMTSDSMKAHPTAPTTYVDGVRALQEECSRLELRTHPRYYFFSGSLNSNTYRPLTFKENIQARVEAYESGDYSLFGIVEDSLSSCTGIAYKKYTTQFKIITQSEHLITIDTRFEPSLSHHGPFYEPFYFLADYDALVGTELDSSFGEYNINLTKSDVLEHPGWLALLEEDRSLLKTYCDIVFAEYRRRPHASIYVDELMSFNVKKNRPEYELQPVSVCTLYHASSVVGDRGLFESTRFLLKE
ncbi:hypothetical protein HYX11_03140 [Candidatus Woesearchaeota archaeon]|nr:hypothetical protein [Candidatus Woesearchaeota archaeon]